MASNVIDSGLYKDMFGDSQMRRVFSDERMVQAWLDFESALARAQARVGMIPESAAQEITEKAHVDRIDFGKLKQLIDETVHPIVPLIRCLADLCEPETSAFIHWGATTQDVMDTGAVVQMREAHELISTELVKVANALEHLARKHRETLMAGRTHGQHALPITFGYKVAVWLDEVYRHQDRLLEVKDRLFVGQFSGAVGTLASLGSKGLLVQNLLMEDLGLKVPRIAWHSSRDRVTEFLMVLGLIGGTLHKIAAEIVTSQKTEYGELEEPFHVGKIGSSTMPHKRNPMVCELVCAQGVLVRDVVASSLTAMIHDHERDMAAWPIEWDILPRACIHLHSMTSKMAFVLEGLVVKHARMKRNVKLTKGLMLSEAIMMELATRLGRQVAHERVYEICIEAEESGTSLEVLLNRAPDIAEVLSSQELHSLLNPENYTGLAADFVDRVVPG